MIARLPQLERLDGKEITRTDRIKAQQRLPALREEIVPLAEEVRFFCFSSRRPFPFSPFSPYSRHGTAEFRALSRISALSSLSLSLIHAEPHGTPENPPYKSFQEACVHCLHMYRHAVRIFYYCFPNEPTRR